MAATRTSKSVVSPPLVGEKGKQGSLLHLGVIDIWGWILPCPGGLPVLAGCLAASLAPPPPGCQ